MFMQKRGLGVVAIVLIVLAVAGVGLAVSKNDVLFAPKQVGIDDGKGGSISYSLTVSKTGTGQGTITSNPAGINCGSDCSEAYSSGTSVRLSATPSSGSAFAGWSGACTNPTGSCGVTMNANKNVVANFNLLPTHLACVSNTCSVVSGAGNNTCSPQGSACGNSCTDTDGGVNYLVRGTATSTNQSGSYNVTDFCDGANINEYYCGSGNVVVSYGLCSSFVGSGSTCVNGACTQNSSLPDLIVEDISYFLLQNNTVNATVQIMGHVKNNGVAVAGNSHTRFLGTGSLGSQYIFTSSINPGQSRILNKTYTIPHGFYFMNVTADVYNNVTESNENNNLRAESFYF